MTQDLGFDKIPSVRKINEYLKIVNGPGTLDDPIIPEVFHVPANYDFCKSLNKFVVAVEAKPTDRLGRNRLRAIYRSMPSDVKMDFSLIFVHELGIYSYISIVEILSMGFRKKEKKAFFS